MRIANFRIYEKGYLPKKLLNAVLKLYKAKTELKGVAGKEEEYAAAKANINSVYGSMVTSIVQPKNTYENDEWCVEEPDIEEELKKYNESKQRYLFYVWGVFVTAISRWRLCKMIAACGDDYIYCDTDSVKYLNREKNKHFFEEDNQWVLEQHQKVADYLGIDVSELSPVTIQGKKKPLGVWEYEGTMTIKCLGAKRYMTQDEDGYHITVAGVSKSLGSEFVSQQKNPFDCFDNNLVIPCDYSGKLTHYYIDYEVRTTLTDLNGVECPIYEKSCINLESCSYNLSMADKYLDFLNGLILEWE